MCVCISSLYDRLELDRGIYIYAHMHALCITSSQQIQKKNGNEWLQYCLILCVHSLFLDLFMVLLIL